MHKYNEIAVKWFFVGFVAFFVFASVFLQGCTSVLTAAQAQQMTPEQIKAYSDSGQAVSGCITVGGPSIGGRTTILILPKDRPSAIEFAPDCQIKSGLIGTTTPTPALTPAPIVPPK